MPPTRGHGKICYIEIPANDIAQSAEFYRKVFGWNIRSRSDGSVTFDDGVGEVSGSWRLGRDPAQPGLMVYVSVTSVAETMDAVVANGGIIEQSIGGDAGEITARFLDPAGNLIGLHQEPLTRG